MGRQSQYVITHRQFILIYIFYLGHFCGLPSLSSISRLHSFYHALLQIKFWCLRPQYHPPLLMLWCNWGKSNKPTGYQKKVLC
jgi:hypothetical protein